MLHNHQPKDEELMDPKLFGTRTHLGSLTHCSYQGNPLLEVLNGICMPGGCYPLVQGERKLLLLISCSSEPDTPNPASEKTQAARHRHIKMPNIWAHVMSKNHFAVLLQTSWCQASPGREPFQSWSHPRAFDDPPPVPEQCTAITCSCATHSSLPATLKRLPSNYLHKKLLRNVFVWKGLEWQSLKKLKKKLA